MKLRYIVVFITLMVLASVFTACSLQETEEEVKEDRYVPVEVETVQKSSISNITTISGKIYADKEVMVVPKLPGKVEEVKVKTGDRVNKGDLLFALDKKDVQNQINQAKAAVNIARSNYNMSKEKIESAKDSLERTRQLYEQGVVSKSQLEQVELAASDLTLEVVAAQVSQAETAYQQAVETLENLTVVSPIDGFVATVNIETGEMASNAQPSMTIINTERVYTMIEVTAEIVSKLEKGSKVLLNIPALDNRLIEGHIETISPSSDVRTQLYPVNVYMDNRNGDIKPGMFTRVEVETDLRENVIAVRSEALILKNGCMVAFVEENGIAVKKEVSIGLDTGEYIEVIEGLDLGEKLIVKGQDYVSDGIKVKLVGGIEQ